MNPHPPVFAVLYGLYWRLALVPAVWIPVVVLYGGPVMRTATLLYWSVLGIAFLLARARPQWERTLVSSHLGTALLTAIYCLVSAPGEVVQGLSSGEWRLGVVAFLTIGMYVFTSFTGVVGLLVGLGVVFLAPWPSWESRLLLAAGSFLAAVAGVSVHKLLYRLEALQRLIQREAITDALTGLANRRALERDFPRYQALANREGLGLAISLWDLDNIRFLTSEEGFTLWTKGTGYVPLLPNLADDPRYLKDFIAKNPIQRVGIDQLPNTYRWTSFPGGNGLAASQALFKATQRALGGQASAQVALSEAAQEVSRLIQGEKCVR